MRRCSITAILIKRSEQLYGTAAAQTLGPTITDVLKLMHRSIMSDGGSFRRARVSFQESTIYHEGSGKRNLWLPSAQLNDPDKPFRRIRSEEALDDRRKVPEGGIGTHPPRGIYKAYRSYTKHLIDATGTPSATANKDVVFKRARAAAADMEMLHSHQQG